MGKWYTDIKMDKYINNKEPINLTILKNKSNWLKKSENNNSYNIL